MGRGDGAGICQMSLRQTRQLYYWCRQISQLLFMEVRNRHAQYYTIHVRACTYVLSLSAFERVCRSPLTCSKPSNACILKEIFRTKNNNKINVSINHTRAQPTTTADDYHSTNNKIIIIISICMCNTREVDAVHNFAIPNGTHILIQLKVID